MPYKSDAPRVDAGLRREKVDGAAQAPGPRANRAPVIGSGTNGAHPIGDAAREIRLDVVVVDGGQPITGGEDLLHLPARRVDAACAVVRRQAYHFRLVVFFGRGVVDLVRRAAHPYV